MKKKIIYFCAGVLLTSLILVAWQVFATTPNPGHDASECTFDGKSVQKLIVWAPAYVEMAVILDGTCNATCEDAMPGSTCTDVKSSSSWKGSAYCGSTSIFGVAVNTCRCQYVDYYSAYWK